MSTTTVTDTLGVAVTPGDTVRVVHRGYGIRAEDCGRLVHVEGVTARGNLVVADDPAVAHDPTARGRSLRPGCVAVMRHDGGAGFEGNRT